MKKLLLSLCMILAFTACKDEQKANQQANIKPVVKIGAIIPLSGPQASMGESAKAGMQKALAEKNKADLHYDYQFVFEDNQAKLSSMPAIANKLVGQDNVDAISTITSAMAKVISPITEQKEKLLYVFSIEEKDYERFGENVYVQGLSIESIADKLVDRFLKNNIDNISIYAENIGVLASLTAYLDKKLSLTDIKYEINNFNPGERDFRIVIESTKNKGFNNFFEVAFPPERDILLKQMTEAGIEKNNIYSYSLDLGKPMDLYEGMTTITYNTGSDEFIQSIQTEYQISNVYGAAVFYDFVNLLVDSFEHLAKNGEKPSIEELNAYIQNKKEYKCASGNCVINNNGFILNEPILRKFTDGKWQRVEE